MDSEAAAEEVLLQLRQVVADHRRDLAEQQVSQLRDELDLLEAPQRLARLGDAMRDLLKNLPPDEPQVAARRPPPTPTVLDAPLFKWARQQDPPCPWDDDPIPRHDFSALLASINPPPTTLLSRGARLSGPNDDHDRREDYSDDERDAGGPNDDDHDRREDYFDDERDAEADYDSDPAGGRVAAAVDHYPSTEMASAHDDAMPP